MNPALYYWPIPALWAVWLIYWLVSAGHVKATRQREPTLSRLAHIVPLTLAAVLLVRPRLVIPVPALQHRLLPWPLTTYWFGVALLAAGLAFSVWARRSLGDNWSGSVTLKEQHELVQSGPYRWIRHPIYTGLLAAFAGCALARPYLVSVIACLIALAALLRKLKLEERWMTEQFGERYVQYCARTGALLPRLRG